MRSKSSRARRGLGTARRKPVMTDGIRLRLFKVRSFSLKIARKLYSELRNLYSLDSMDSIRQYRQGIQRTLHSIYGRVLEEEKPAE